MASDSIKYGLYVAKTGKKNTREFIEQEVSLCTL
jgi:hypothetical protein